MYMYICVECVYVFMNMCTCMWVHMPVFLYVWRSETDIRCIPQSLHTLFFLRQYLIEPRDY